MSTELELFKAHAQAHMQNLPSKPSFVVDDENRYVIIDLVNHFQGKQAVMTNIFDPFKGILLMGNVGSGKTLLMRIMQKCSSGFGFHTCRKVAQIFVSEGYEKIRVWGADSKNEICFDDIGAEMEAKFYGNKAEVLGELILDRYELYLATGLRTHFTTNLSFEEITARYGNRVSSRLVEMCNFVILGSGTNSKDRRRK